MFISHQYKLVFLEVPRTASRSVTTALTDLDPDSETAISRRERGPQAKYHTFSCPELKRDDYLVVAGHRNPFHRLWSFWKHRHRHGNPPIFQSISWQRYLEWVCDPARVPEIQNAIVDKPISEMFDCDRVDVWLKFEDMATSWTRLEQVMGTTLPKLEISNVSARPHDTPEIYNPYNAARVIERFQADFDRFGYAEDSWKGMSGGFNLGNVATISRRDAAASESPDHQMVIAKRRRVALLTPFERPFEAFSLNRVVQDQISMLVKHGYAPVVMVLDSPYWDTTSGSYALNGVTLVRLAQVKMVNVPGEEEPFTQDVERLIVEMTAALEGVDVVLTHDIVYQPRYLKLFIAARRTADRWPDIRWCHWIHSATAPLKLKRPGISEEIFPEMINQVWPNSYLISFNRISIPRIAKNFNYEERDVKFVPHPTDVCQFLGLSELSKRLYEDKQLYLVDYMAVYPVRLDEGKQVEWVVRIMSRLKASGAVIRIVVMDFHSRFDDQKKKYREKIKSEALEWDVSEDELIFLSEYDASLRMEAHHSMVRELFALSHVFIMPSRSESYSLATQEAALLGNLLVLNADFPPTREIFGENALYFQFSSAIDRLNIDDGFTQLRIADVECETKPQGFPPDLIYEKEGKWFVRGHAMHADAIANRIRYEFENNRVLKQRQQRLKDRNLFSVFKHYLEPLIDTDLDRPETSPGYAAGEP